MNTPTPYITYPPWARRAHKLLLDAQYKVCLGIGVAALLTGEATAPAVVVILAALCAEVGIITGLYRWEWVALAPLITGLLIVALMLVCDGFGVHLLAIAPALMLAERWVYLARVAAYQRARHTRKG